MNHQQSVLIFSTFQSGQTSTLNVTYHNELIGFLQSEKIPHIEAQGHYKGERELSIIVPTRYESLVQKLMRDHNQETYLYLDSNNIATLHDHTGRITDVLGRMREINDVVGRDAYTIVGGRYFVAE